MGMTYLCGRDKKFRPVLYIDIPKILTCQAYKEDVLNALSYLITIASTFMFYPGKIEQITVVVDLIKFEQTIGNYHVN